MLQIYLHHSSGQKTPYSFHSGESLLHVAQRNGADLEGACGGVMACATCHVIIDTQSLGLLPPPSAEEKAMLDITPNAIKCSRLACQVILTEAMNGLTARVAT